MSDYKDLITHLNDSIGNIKELQEIAANLHNDIATALLETSALYTPQIVIDHHEMLEDGRKCDMYIAQGQDMKSEIESFLSTPQKSTDEYRNILEELKGIHNSLYSKPEFNL